MGFLEVALLSRSFVKVSFVFFQGEIDVALFLMRVLEKEESSRNNRGKCWERHFLRVGSCDYESILALDAS